MGFKLFGRKGGWSCDTVNENGSRTCRRFEVDKSGQRILTGTEVTIGVDNETCSPVFGGDAQFLLDDDDRHIEEIAKKMTTQCKREKGL